MFVQRLPWIFNDFYDQKCTFVDIAIRSQRVLFYGHSKFTQVIKSVFIAGLGGFIGTVMRFVLARYLQLQVDSVFPWGTFAVNIAGSFLIGIFYGLSEREGIMSAEWRIFLTIGVCGGFTTFSSLSNDAFFLMQNKEWLRFAAYAGFSFTLGLMAVYLGRTAIKAIY